MGDGRDDREEKRDVNFSRGFPQRSLSRPRSLGFAARSKGKRGQRGTGSPSLRRLSITKRVYTRPNILQFGLMD